MLFRSEKLLMDIMSKEFRFVEFIKAVLGTVIGLTQGCFLFFHILQFGAELRSCGSYNSQYYRHHKKHKLSGISTDRYDHNVTL